MMLKSVATVPKRRVGGRLRSISRGSEDSFVSRMNERAKELGRGIPFENCTGLSGGKYYFGLGMR